MSAWHCCLCIYFTWQWRHMSTVASQIKGNSTVFIECLVHVNNKENNGHTLRAYLHQRGAGPPAGVGSVFRAGRVFTLARVRAQFHCSGAPFRGTGSLIYKYRPISAPYSCGSCRRIAPWAISAGAAERARGGVNSTTQFLQTDPLRNPRAGSVWAFSALV